MILPDDIAESSISLKDQYFDLKGLEAYSALRVPTLRDYIKSGDLPCFKVKGKILIRKSEFDAWLENYRVNRKQDLNNVVDNVMSSLKSHESK
jgi:excisionase family DNA binding protein